MKTLTELVIDRINQDCGEWEIPIDDVNGELCIENPARRVWVIELEPVGEVIKSLAQALEKAEGALEWFAKGGPVWSVHSKSFEPTFSNSEAKRANEALAEIQKLKEEIK